ncbi:hypothetical protein BC828DRAFT_383676 [Blastocladiella britannica]|nr:hypothetical protein BC828DRAFT_383676 [Blastocladiella britannica]
MHAATQKLLATLVLVLAMATTLTHAQSKLMNYKLGPFGSKRADGGQPSSDFTCRPGDSISSLALYYGDAGVSGVLARCATGGGSAWLRDGTATTSRNTTLDLTPSPWSRLLIRAGPNNITQIGTADDKNFAGTSSVEPIVFDPNESTSNYILTQAGCKLFGISLYPNVPAIDSLIMSVNCEKPLDFKDTSKTLFGIAVTGTDIDPTTTTTPAPSTTSSPTATPSPDASAGKPSSSLLAVIILASVVGVVALAFVAGFHVQRKRDQAEDVGPSHYGSKPDGGSGYHPNNPYSTGAADPPNQGSRGSHTGGDMVISAPLPSYHGDEYNVVDAYAAPPGAPPSPTFVDAAFASASMQRKPSSPMAPQPTSVQGMYSLDRSRTGGSGYDGSMDRSGAMIPLPTSTPRRSNGTLSTQGPGGYTRPVVVGSAYPGAPPIPPSPTGPAFAVPSVRRGSDATSIVEIGQANPDLASSTVGTGPLVQGSQGGNGGFATSAGNRASIAPSVTPIVVDGPRMVATEYLATAPDEVDVQEGDMVSVHAVYSDGWAYVTNRTLASVAGSAAGAANAKGLVPITCIDAQVADVALIQMQQAMLMKGVLQAVQLGGVRGQ